MVVGVLPVVDVMHQDEPMKDEVEIVKIVEEIKKVKEVEELSCCCCCLPIGLSTTSGILSR